MGVDFSILDMISVELTKAETVAEDQLLNVPLAGFYGYGSQWQNAGTLTSDVFELSVNASVLNTRDMSLSLGFNYDTYDQQITEFNLPAYITSIGQNVFYMKNNTQYGAFWGTVWATSTSELPAGAPTSEFQVNDDGYLVWVGEGNTWKDGIDKKLWGTSTTIDGRTYGWGRPIQYVDETGNALHQMGTSVPDFSYAFNANFRFKGLSVFAMFDGQSGGEIYNHTRQWAARDDGSDDVDQYGKSPETQKPTVYYRDMYHVNAPNSFYVEDGSYLKLRELAVKYDLASLIDLRGVGINGLKLGVVGRNLITWTDYRGYDPEVGGSGGQLGSAVNARVDSYGYPNYRTFSFTLDLDFQRGNKMKTLRNKLSITLLAGLTLFACADLDVSNTNAPDQDRALAKPEDVESLIRSTFLVFWQGTHLSGNSWFISTQGDGMSCSWGNWGMRELSSEPRIAHNNSPAWNYAGAADDVWYRLYGAISSAKDGLSALAGGLTLNTDADPNADTRATIFARWVLGMSHAMIAIHHDQGFIITEETDFAAGTPELSSYSDIMTAAIGILNQVIADANANASVTIPESWLHLAGFTMADLAKVTHSMIARYTAGVARNATERAAVDWNSVKSHAAQGTTFAPVGDTQYLPAAGLLRW